MPVASTPVVAPAVLGKDRATGNAYQAVQILAVPDFCQDRDREPDVEESPEAQPTSGAEAVDAGICSLIHALLWTIFVPTTLFSIGQSITYPTLPVYAQSLDLSGTRLGLSMAGLSLGRLSTNMLSGLVLSSVGVRTTMVASFLALSIGALVASNSVGFILLFFGLLLCGFGASLEAIGRMTYAKDVVPNSHRGRMIAVLGGTTRLGAILGPAIGGWIARVGGLRSSFGLQIPIYLLGAVTCAIAFPSNAALATRPSGAPTTGTVSDTPLAGSPGHTTNATTYRGVIRRHWRLLVRVGFAMFGIQFLRSARVVLIPLIGHAMGLATDRIGLALTTSYIVDSTLFPVVGVISDAYGRKWVATPAFVFLTAGLFALSAANSFHGVLLTAALAGFGNGLSSGIVMTTGTDVAPAHPEASLFLGLYGIFCDSGETLSPIIIGVVAKAFDFRTAGVWAGVVGIVGLVWYVCLVPESRTHDREAAQLRPRCWPLRARGVAPVELAPIAAGVVVGNPQECDDKDDDGEGQVEVV